MARMIFRKPEAGLRHRLSFDDFTIIEQVGEGTYGRVFKARNIHTNKLSALKVVFPTEDDEGLPFTAVREIKYLQMLHDNSNIIRLEGTFFTKDGELVLAFEYMENDLSGLLSLKNLQFSPAQTKCLFKQVLEGLHQCHSAGIMHRDIKAANLLLNNGQLKLADFGLASNYLRRRTFSTNVVTLWYRAPELLLGVNSYGPKVDIWSAGCLFIELLTRQSPFPGREEKHQLELIVRTCGTPTEKNWPGVTKLEGYQGQLQGLMGHQSRLGEVFNKFDPRALDLLSRMLALDPAQRPSASEALDHDYFWSDPLPCKATELPHYPAMHEYEAKKTRQNERQPKRQKVTGLATNNSIAPLRSHSSGTGPAPSHHLQQQTNHLPLPPPHSSSRHPLPPSSASHTSTYPPSKAGTYGQPPSADVRRNQHPPPMGSQWGSHAAHGTHHSHHHPHPHHPGRLHASSGCDGILPTPSLLLPTHSSAHPGAYPPAAAAHSRPGATVTGAARHPHRHSQHHPQMQSTSFAANGGASGGAPPPPSHHHPRSSNGAVHELTAGGGSRATTISHHGAHFPARNGDYHRGPAPRDHRPPSSASSAMTASSLGGGGGGGHPSVDGPRHEMPMASYNRPPAGAHRPHYRHPHHHAAITDSHASASYNVHMSHARATLSSVERMEVGIDTASKRKREAAAPL